MPLLWVIYVAAEVKLVCLLHVFLHHGAIAVPCCIVVINFLIMCLCTFQCVASKIGLPLHFLYYFGLYLVCKDPNADFTSILLSLLDLLNDLMQHLSSQLLFCSLTVLLIYVLFILRERNNSGMHIYHAFLWKKQLLHFA